MTSWNYLIRFKATDGKIYFASIDAPKKTSELAHLSVTGFPSFEDLQNQTKEQPVTVKEVRTDTMVEFCLEFSSSHPVMLTKFVSNLTGAGASTIQ